MGETFDKRSKDVRDSMEFPKISDFYKYKGKHNCASQLKESILQGILTMSSDPEFDSSYDAKVITDESTDTSTQSYYNEWSVKVTRNLPLVYW